MNSRVKERAACWPRHSSPKPTSFVAQLKDLKLADGRDRVVRHGYGPERTIQTGIGAVAVRRVKVRDRGEVIEAEKIRFTSAILPLWARRTKSLDALLPILYLRGISTGDFQEALTALLGKDAPNLSPAVVARLPLKTLLFWRAVVAIPQMVPLLFIHSVTGALIAAMPIGLMGGVASAAYLDLIIRSCPRGQ